MWCRGCYGEKERDVADLKANKWNGGACNQLGMEGGASPRIDIDDLLVLCHGDEISVNVIKEALMEFSNCSGLKPNMEKSVVFFGSVNEVTKKKILAILPFKVGKLPVKYLGVTLLAKKLRINDSKQLVDKVKCKIQDWKNIFLSYL
ncbi:hypothetical protein Tco_1495986, partial [Tanacetum coccineum]